MRQPTEQQSMAPRDLETHLETSETYSMPYVQSDSTPTAHSTRAAGAITKALRYGKVLSFSQALVLVLCYSIVIQPNAALAAQPSLISATALSTKGPTANTETSSVVAETSSTTNPSNPLAVPVPSPVAAITDAVVTRHKPTLTSGRIEGSLRVLLGESFAITTSAQLLGDLYLPGNPVVQLNTGAQHGGLVNDGGSTSPTGYTVTLNNNVNLPGRIHTKADAVQLPPDYPGSVPAAMGTRSVSVRYASDIAAIGNWQTVRDVSVTGSGLTLNMPPGNYGTLTVNGNCQVNLSAGIYNFANTFNLDGSARLQSTGRVAINVAQNVTINSGALTLGSYTAPADVRLNVLGALLKINGSSQVNGLVRAYTAAVTLNNTAQLRGQVIADSFTLNGGKVIGAVWPVQSGSSMMIFGPRRFDRTTGQPNQYVEQFSLPSGITSPYTLHIQNGEPNGTNRVSSATVKLNGIDILRPSDLNENVAGLDRTVNLAANNQLDVRLASSPGSYLIINIIGGMPASDTAPPTVAITAPANGTVTAESQISVSGTASDTGTGATGVAHVYVNDLEAAYSSSDGTWSLANVPLTEGANQITARAVDHAGNPATASIAVTREAPENHEPDVNAGTDQSLTLPQTANLQGTATDDGLPAGSSLTTTWTMVSGAGTVTFANAQALSTTASFSTAGTYVLNLSATDSVLTKSDEITITVQPQNQPPTVSAGSDQTIALPRTAGLNGTVTDDGLPAGGALSLAWSQVSGPGSVTFEAPTLAETTAAFSVAGVYVLRLSASDTDLSSASEITITVQPENQAPTVAAGPDQIIVLPNDAQLNGSVSDDGWPAGSSLTCQWSGTSGPGPITIDNPNVTVTRVSFSVPGVYGLRLSCSDSELSSSDDLTINVAPPPDNTAPVLNITSHADNETTQAETITVSGSVSDPGEYASGVSQVTVNDVAATLDAQAGTWMRSGVPLVIGPNVITVRAVDNAGKDTTQTITINRAPPPDLLAPTIAITSPYNNFISPDAAITVTGTAIDEGPYATGVRRVLVNGQPATYDPATHQWTATGIGLTEGPNTIQVLADDNATPTNTREASISVTRHTPDTKAPTVTIVSPMSSFETYDGTLSVAGTAIDDGLNATGVDRVTVNGVDANYNAATSQWSVAALPLTYGDNHIVVVATDKAPTPNQGSANVHVTRIRIPPPTLAISNPQNGAVLAATSITVAGSVSSLGSTPTVTVNGENAVVSGGQFARTVSLIEGANTITVVATDSIAQQSQASLSVIRDLSAPSVSFANVPASVQPGGTYQILVDATDNVGVADVEFRLNGQYVATAATAPYQFTLDVPSVYAAGANLVLSAVARDLTNTTAVATAQTRTGGPGGISGYVFDDTTGYVLQGVNALLNSEGSVVTDELGVFNLVSSSPSGVVRLTKDGHTLVERIYSVSIGEGTALFDARLTPMDSQTNLIGVAGATAAGDSGRLQVSFPAGTFNEATDIRVTNVSPQGLANLLPYGWSPVPGAVVDLRAASSSSAALQAFPAPAHLTISQVSGLNSATPLTLVRYDETSHRWMVVAAGLYATASGADGGSLSADVPRMGQYAFLVADIGSTAPPPPVMGQPLTAAQPADSAALDKTQASAVATPRTAVFSATARSAISFFANAPTQLPSGVTIDATFGETYNLLGGRDSVLVDRPAQDFVLYSYPAASSHQPNRLGAFFVAKPTRTEFTLTELFNANVHVEIRSGRQTRLGALIGGNGGGVRASDGSQLTIPANAMPGSQSVFFNDLSPELANVNLPEGYEIVGAFDLDLGSAALNSSATISVPGINGDLSRIVVARLLTVGGQRSPKVVARAVADSSGKLNSAIATPSVPSGVVLNGIRTSGRYLFIRVPQPFGYIKGTIIDASTSNPLGMVKVSNNQTPFIDVTAADGQFVVVGSAGTDATGTNQIGAAALSTDATGKASASLNAQDTVASVNISVSSVPLEVESITPAANAQNMIATTPVTVSFNKPIAASSVTGSSFTLSTAGGNPVLGAITVLAGSRVAVFTPAATLAASTTYKVSLNQSVRDIYGYPLAAAFNSTFATAATVTVGNRLRPEQIVINYPDANGVSSISIPAQSVPEGSTLLVVNTTSGSTLSTVAGTAALLLQIQARVGDEITLTISQPDGTQYRVTQAAYRRADGFISVGSNGGTITSDDGKILLSVPAGAISGQADLKLTSRAESDIAIPRQGEMAPAEVPFGAGVRITVSGNFTNDQELHLQVAAPPNATEGQRVAFMKPAKFTDAGGERDVWEVVTSGKTEGGKFKTMSPPFYGVTIASNLGFFDYYVFIPRKIRAVTGIVTEHVNLGAPKPLANVIVQINSGAGNPPASVIARSAANGRFGTLDYAVSSASSVDILATDQLGRTKTGGATPYLSANPIQDPGLNGLSTMYAAIEFPSSDGLPETLPALLHMEGRMLELESGQPDTLQEVGRVVLGSHLEIKTTATPNVQQISGQLLAGGSVIRELVWINSGSGVYVTDFTVDAEGSYSVAVTTHTLANVATTKATATFSFVGQSDPNTRPSLEGPPRVLSVTPADKAQQVNTGTRIHLEFSEPVKNLVPGQTIYLTNRSNLERISSDLTSGGLPIGPNQPNISSVDLLPERTLEASKEYVVEVTSGVTDSQNHPLDQEYTSPTDTSAEPFRSTFTTFRSLVLTETPPETDSYRIAAAGDLAITVTPGSGSTMHIWDITNPDSLKLMSSKFVPNYGVAFDIADAELDEDYIKLDNQPGQKYGTIAVVASVNPQDTSRPINLWIYSLDDPANSKMIGVVSLNISASVPAFPTYVKIHHRRAYIGNSGRGGVEVVDLQEAVNMQAKDGLGLAALKAVQPHGGYAQETKKQKATHGHSNTEAAPVFSVSLMDQNVPAASGGGASKSPVAYIASNKLQLINFDHNPNLYDNHLVFSDSNGDTYDDLLLAARDLTPAGYALDVRAVPSVNLHGQATDMAVLLGHERLWIFEVTNPRDPHPYPSRSFIDMGLGPDYARRMDVEGTLAYVMFTDKVAVIDFSDPTRPFVSSTITDIGTNLRWLAVKDGFVYTLDGDTTTRTAKLRTSIGGAAALVYMHGANDDENNVCANPVLISRTDSRMLQPAEMIFKVYGHDKPLSQKVIIRKEIRSADQTIVEVLGEAVVELDPQSPNNIVVGKAKWTSSAPIDRSSLYTAELILDEGQATEFRARRADIPFSNLIDQYQDDWGIPQYGGIGHMLYLLGGSADLTLMVQGPGGWNTVQLQNGNTRVYGLHNEEMLRSLPGLNNLPAGRYLFSLTAQARDLLGVTETVLGNVTIGDERPEIRIPGSVLVGGVELESGNLGLSHTDISEIKNRGLSLSFTRSYNSAASSSFNPLGYGWRHNYQVLLTHHTQGNPSDPNRPAGPYYEISGGEGSGHVFLESDVAAGVEAKARAPHHGRLRKNADETFDYFTKSHVKYHFNQEIKSGTASLFNLGYMGNLAYIEEPNGNRLTLNYDGQGRLFSVVDSSGRKLEFTYEQALTPFVGTVDAGSITGQSTNCTSRRFMRSLRQRFLQAELGRAWHIIQVKGPGGIEINYDYDGFGNLERATRVGTDSISQSTGDSIWQYAYNPTEGANANPNYNHLLKSVKPPNQTLAAQRLTTYEYELTQPGRPVKTVRMPESVSYGYSYTFTSGKITAAVVTDGRDNPTSYQFAKGPGNTKVVTSVAPRGAQSVTTFDDHGNRVSEVDPEGTTTTYVYDNGNPVEVTVTGQGLVQRRSATYESTFNKLTSVTDANQHTTNYTVDGRGNVTRVQLPTGRAVTMDYRSNGDLERTTDQYGFATNYENHDAYGNPQTIRRQASSGSFVTTHQTFDTRSRQKTSEDDLAATVSSTYDALDHLLQQTVTDPTGFRETMISTMTYLAEGQLKTMTQSGGSQQMTIVNEYDALNRVVLTTETPSGAAPFVRPFKYDRNSNLEEVTDRRGVKRTQTFDALNFVTSETLSGPYGPSLATMTVLDIDKVGNPKEVRNLYGQTARMDYDGLHRLSVRHLPGNYTEEFGYDGNGNVILSKDRNGRETRFEFDPINRQKRMRDPAGRVTTWTFDDSTRSVTIQRTPQSLTELIQEDGLGRLLRREVQFGSNNYVTTNVYAGRKVTTTDPRSTVTVRDLSAFNENGRVTVNGADPAYAMEMRYGGLGGMRSSKDSLSRETTYTLDGLSRATQINYPGGFGESFIYDGDGLVLSHTDRRSVVSTSTYDNLRRKLTDKVQDGTQHVAVLTVQYDDAGNRETRTDAEGHATVFVYDGLRRVSSLTNADNKIKNYFYDGMNLQRESDFKGAFTEYDYDAVDRVRFIKDRKGQVVNIAHSDSNGYSKTTTDRRGNVDVETYDPLGRLSHQTQGGEPLASYQYDGNNNRTLMVDAVGNQTVYTYDKLNRLKTANHAAGLQTETFTYDAMGNVVTQNDGRGAGVTMAYDDLDHLKTRTDGEGNVTRLRYDGEGLLLEKTDPKSAAHKTTYDYNALGSLKKITDARSGLWEFQYDGTQNLRSVKDALSRIVSYEYDALNRLERVTQPQSLITTYGYDANGNRNSVTDPKGQTTTIVYDELDRPNTLAYANTSGAGPVGFDFGFDPEDNLTSVAEKTTSTTTRNYARSYDARNRLKTTTDPFNRTVAFAYYPTNKLKSIKDAAQKETTYSYDPLNRLQNVVMTGGAVAAYSWYTDGLLKQVDYGAGMKREYAYDNADRLTQVINTVGTDPSPQTQQFVYGYDPNSNRATETRKINGQTTRGVTYNYDLLDRLISASYTTPGQRPANPPAGQSVSYTEGARQTGFDYDAVGNRTTASAQDHTTTVTLTTDTEGATTEARQTVDGPLVTATSQFDQLNRLTQLTNDAAGSLPVTYAYDNNGNLISTTQSNQLTAQYEYDCRDQLRRVLNGSSQELASYDYDFERHRISKTVGATALKYVYGGDQVIGEYNASNQLQNRYDLGANEVVRGELGGEGTRHYFSDGLSSVTALSQQPTTTSSSLTAAYEYDAWGNYFSASGGSNNAIGYTGQRFDGETGLMPLGNGERYYSPIAGSFIQQDSFTGMATAVQSLNRYAYAHNNPLRFIDRNGNKSQEPTNDPDAVTNVAEGAGNFLWNLLEPLRQVADVLVAGAAANEGIEAKYVKMSSNLGQSSQEAVLAGQDPWDVALGSIHSQMYGYATLGLDQFTEPFVDMAAYYDGNISLPEYNKRMGGHLANAGLALFGRAGRGGRGGAGRAKAAVLAEKSVALASERLPLSRSAAADAPPMPSSIGRARGESSRVASGSRDALAAESGASRGPITNPNRLLAASEPTVFSGHGTFDIGKGMVTIPEGTSLTVYSKLGGSIYNTLGNAIELGQDLTGVYSKTYLPRMKAPNYTLHPAPDLDILGNPVTVLRPTPLTELLKPNMGECRWAACTYNPKASSANETWDLP